MTVGSHPGRPRSAEPPPAASTSAPLLGRARALTRQGPPQERRALPSGALGDEAAPPSDQALRRYVTGSLLALQPAGLDQEVDGVGPLGPLIFGTRRQHRWDAAAVGVLAAAPVVKAEPTLADHAAGLGAGARPGHRHGKRLVRGERQLETLLDVEGLAVGHLERAVRRPLDVLAVDGEAQRQSAPQSVGVLDG